MNNNNENNKEKNKKNKEKNNNQNNNIDVRNTMLETSLSKAVDPIKENTDPAAMPIASRAKEFILFWNSPHTPACGSAVVVSAAVVVVLAFVPVGIY